MGSVTCKNDNCPGIQFLTVSPDPYFYFIQYFVGLYNRSTQTSEARMKTVFHHFSSYLP